MKYKLTWKRKMIKQHLTTFICCTLTLLGSVEMAVAQKDSLNPVKLKPMELHFVRPGNELPFSGTELDRETIEERQGNGSINNLLENIPSVVTTSDAGTGIGYTYMRIRGIDHTRINATINGIELNDAESQGTWFVNLPDFASHTGNLSIQRGVGTSSNGSAAFGASMNFSTLEAGFLKPFLEISSAAGSFYTFKNTISIGTGPVNDRFSSSVSYSNIQSKGYIDRATANLNSLFFTADYRLLNKKKNKNFGTLKFNLLYGKEITGLAWDGISSDMLETDRTYNPCGEYYDALGNLNYYDNETDNYQQTHYQLFYQYRKAIDKNNRKHQYDLNIGMHLTRGIGYYEQYKDDKKLSEYDLSPFILGTDTIKRSDLITRKYLDNYFYGLTFNFSDEIKSKIKQRMLRWTVGGAVNRYDGGHYGTIIWMQYAGLVPANARWYNNTGNKIQSNLYGKLEFMPSPKWMLYADAQYRFIDYQIDGMDDNLADITQHLTWNFFNPKIGIHYYLDNRKEHALYFSFAQSHREPTRSDIVDAPDAKKPVAETLYDFELGYSLQLNKFAFNANGYFMYYDDQLVLTGEINDVGDAIMANVDKSYRLGLELVTSYRPAKFFLWRINGTFSINKILNYTHYVDDYDNWPEQVVLELGTTDISFSPNILASNEFVFTPVKNFDITFATKFVSKQYLDNTGDNKHLINPYCVSNLGLSYKIITLPIPEINIFFQVNNIFNAKYESNGWLYRYYEGGAEYYSDGYFPQAGINFMGGVKIKL